MAKQKSKFAILGLLSWKPMSGYDIKKLIDIGLSHFWQENYGQIYPTLESLVKEGLATKREASGQRKRFIYTITKKGQQVFRDWLAEPTTTPVVKNELQLKFFLSCTRPSTERIRLINEYEAQQRRVLLDYQRSEKVLQEAIRDGRVSPELDELLAMTSKKQSRQSRMKQCKAFLLTLRHGIRVAESKLAWCGEVLKSLQE